MATDSNTREIPLTQGKVALVDADDYERLAQFNWYALYSPSGFYAVRKSPTVNGKRTMIIMARVILDAESGLMVDHISGDTLDNRRSNLRFATRAENGANRISGTRLTSSCYKGVTWNAKQSKWQAQICANGKKTYLGIFADEIAAAHAYDTAARTHFKEFARPNFTECTTDD